MQKATNNSPALEALGAIGYGFLAKLAYADIQDCYKLKKPNGACRIMKIHKSGSSSGPNGRHRFGITRAFHRVDDFVLWAKHESVILVIPSNVVRTYYNACSGRQITPSGQWVINVYFDIDGGNQRLCAVNDRNRYEISEYAHPVH